VTAYLLVLVSVSVVNLALLDSLVPLVDAGLQISRVRGLSEHMSLIKTTLLVDFLGLLGFLLLQHCGQLALIGVGLLDIIGGFFDVLSDLSVGGVGVRVIIGVVSVYMKYNYVYYCDTCYTGLGLVYNG
jgi:hypothetical protein